MVEIFFVHGYVHGLFEAADATMKDCFFSDNVHVVPHTEDGLLLILSMLVYYYAGMVTCGNIKCAHKCSNITIGQACACHKGYSVHGSHCKGRKHKQ